MTDPAPKHPASGPVFSDDDFRATATAFSQAAGVFGGFSMTIFVLVLPPEFLKNYTSAKDVVVGLILLATFLYGSACLFLANSMNSLIISEQKKRVRAYSLGIKLLHSANISLVAALTTLVWQFSLMIGWITVSVIALVAIIVAVRNFGEGLLDWIFTTFNIDISS